MEIGSEFWKQPKKFIRDDEEIYLSGRTALDIIVKDAIKCYGITSALLPSYCCHTMIEPFLINGISVRFYDVYVDRSGSLVAELPAPIDREILYIMKYFGDVDLLYIGEGASCDGWCSTVEDLTHSCFCDLYESNEDYWFTSYRKWFAVDGISVAGKRSGGLRPAMKGRNDFYCKIRNHAFSMKALFMDGEPVSKKEFLAAFSEAEQLLSEDYQDYDARPESIVDLFQILSHSSQIRRKRRENADVLVTAVDKTNGIHTFVDLNAPSKCPLFVPIMVECGKRDALRKYLIDKDIYCPVHWPLSEQHTGLSERAKKIYKEELSLVCDQRYEISDMERVVQTITAFFEGQ